MFLVRIYGHDYTFTGTESEEYIQKVCYNVDKMRDFRQRDPKTQRNQACNTYGGEHCRRVFLKTRRSFDETIADLKNTRKRLLTLKTNFL
ncbi:MAG: cell division protein ZapA [Clostridiales bacterium]|nr:MAG: cell division protein ZapA [Clostridiales bacterium]